MAERFVRAQLALLQAQATRYAIAGEAERIRRDALRHDSPFDPMNRRL